MFALDANLVQITIGRYAACFAYSFARALPDAAHNPRNNFARRFFGRRKRFRPLRGCDEIVQQSNILLGVQRIE